MPLTRRYLQVGDRRVHYFRAGDGPPVVLIHSSPANARLLMKEIARLARDNTVFAFDTPGFGLSDPLPLAEMEVADLADAMAETLATIGMPPCPIFGTHTGAAIALELGVRHPDRVTGLVLDGVPAFTDEECAAFFGTYFREMPPSELGGHYAEAWTRFRDQAIWFPWTNRLPENHNPYDLSPPHSTHLWVSMFLDAADHYAPAYRAASYWGGRAINAAAALTLPAVFCATTTDMLYSHLERLPPLKPNQSIAEIGDSYECKRELISESVARFGAEGPAPADCDAVASTSGIARQFNDGTQGQIHLRTCGDRTAPTLLLLHDAPGSAEQAEPLIAELATRFFVIAPDLPGSGESDPMAPVPTVDDFADEVAALLSRLDVAIATVHGIGFGSSVALALARRHAGLVTAVVLQGLALPDEGERVTMLASYAVPISIEPDGAHWYRTWLMLRDSQIYWPWYDHRLASLRRVPADFTARRLNRWTMDVMRARESYHHLIHAALEDDAAVALKALDAPFAVVRDPSTPLSAHDDRLRSLRPDAAIIERDAPDFADALSGLSTRSHDV
ncbi:alpha/beta fold hydrolase [Sphingomonas sp. AR_OL41]|uniref:alpha/beta fold hydrolase n=1 Tax=Sphingomonas sp. AR_OL41 TaxID=3042729 RepID=UPI002481143F|nr:alpha/beta hydrolase [Sphingomonas sp. AR_OL41]MDH7973255.1 alpha/beta fold hydrolase [Sphingomonas sp. AR_OL41]